jgi:hypothetical protein
VARFDGGVKLGLALCVERIILQRPRRQQTQDNRHADEEVCQRIEGEL